MPTRLAAPHLGLPTCGTKRALPFVLVLLRFVFLVFSRFFWFFHGVTPEESENIVFFVFLVFSRFFCFFHGVTPEESENIVFFVFFCFPDVFLILGRRSIVFLWGLPQSALRYCIVMTIYEEDKNGILKIRILCRK